MPQSSNSPLSNIFEGLDKKLQVEYDFLSSQFWHKATKGAAREEALRRVLAEVLPAKFSVGTGLVVSSLGEQSKQIDVIIYDTMNTPIIYAYGETRLFPIECVYVVIEVKSKLDTKELKKSGANILSVKNMSKVAFENRGHQPMLLSLHGKNYEHFPVLGFIFAYESVSLRTVWEKLVAIDSGRDIDKRIDSVYVLKRGAIVNHTLPPLDKYLVVPELGTERAYVTSNKVLMFFYLNLSLVLTQATMRPVRMLDYAGDITFGQKNV